MRSDDGRVIPTFITQALRGEDLTVYGDGSQTRSFCFIDDLVTALRALMEARVQDPINLGHPHEITIKSLAEKILELVDTESGMTFKPLPPQDPKVRRPDITKAKQELNWSPQISLEEGLQRTIGWFKEKERK